MLPRKKRLAVIKLKILPRVIRLAVKLAYALASMPAAGPLIIASRATDESGRTEALQIDS